jgi:tetratricopeptide (TPR) repeat protein
LRHLPKVYQTLGGIYSIAGDFELATEIYHQGLAIVPGAARLYVSLAIVDKSNVLEAQQSLAIAEAIYNYWEYKYNTASTSEQQQSAHVSLEDAETEYGMAQNQLKAAIAASQMAMNDLEVAQNAYQEALRLQPDNADALIGLGQLADALGDKENALSYYEKAVALNPTSVAALNALGYAYLDFERPEDAFITFEKSLKYSPTNLGAQFGLVRAYTFLGQSDAMSSAATTYYSSHWWTNFIEYFREREK